MRFRGDRGQVGGIEVIPFGLLVFVVGALLAANAWGAVDVKFATDAAAREATRAYVEAAGPAEAGTAADQAARDAIAGHGRDPDRLGMSVAHENDQPWARCVRVMVTVRYPVPVVRLPWVGGFGHSFDAVSTHSERIDPYRAGLPAGGRC